MKLILFILGFNFFYTICYSQKGAKSDTTLISELQNVKWGTLDSLEYNLFDNAIALHKLLY
jgi:hypothetical protein